jgi:hypothetical protein
MFQFSLWQLFLLVGVIALAIASFKFASPTWNSIVAAICIGTFLVASIIAAVDRGPRQASAIGIVLIMFGYGWLISNGNHVSNTLFGSSFNTDYNPELDQFAGSLPTTVLLRYAHLAMHEYRYVDPGTRQEVAGYDQSDPQFAGLSVVREESPMRRIFMPIGHAWFALLFAYLGGHFARFIYARRTKEQAAPAEK